MSDAELRQRKRDAVAGVPGAEDALARARQRHGQGRHADKIGLPIVIETVQCHRWGTLLGITECGGGVAIAHLHPCFWLSNTESPTVGGADARPRSEPSSLEHPVDVYLSAAVLVRVADADWSYPT